jgi:1,5-anhydro-D-fructose reductase (1,5-anhydro-D-mannitol-forming)
MLPDGTDPISQWIANIRDGTRADDNLDRAVELSRLVTAANMAAASGANVSYSMGTP